MIEYFSWVALLPILFIIPCISFVRKRFENIEPSKLAYGAATTGILLTFFGIWQGLIGFDITETEKSLPVLIEGLKTAFGSSIVGLFTSMLINLFYVPAGAEDEAAAALLELRDSINDFADRSSDQQTRALLSAIESLINELELGINTETKEVMSSFRTSVDFLRRWQERYVEEIVQVTDAMDKNAIVTRETSEQLDRTNKVLAELKPATEQIAHSIGWVRTALPSMRKKAARDVIVNSTRDENEK